MTPVPRAQRFQVPMRVLWRLAGTGEWREGIGVNASRSGVLFRSDRLVAVGTGIDVILALSWEKGASADAPDVICSGRVARTEGSSGSDLSALLAATIEHYSVAIPPESTSDVVDL